MVVVQSRVHNATTCLCPGTYLYGVNLEPYLNVFKPVKWKAPLNMFSSPKESLSLSEYFFDSNINRINNKEWMFVSI